MQNLRSLMSQAGRWGLWASSHWDEHLFTTCKISWSISNKDVLLKLVASLMAQLVNNLLAMQKTWIRTLGQEDPLEKGMATHSSSLAWESWGQRNLAGTLKSLRSQRVSQIQLSSFHFFFFHFLKLVSFGQWSGRQLVISICILRGRNFSGSCIRFYSANQNLQANKWSIKFRSVQSLSRVWLCATPFTREYQASLSITNSQTLLKLMSIKLVMPSNHLTHWCPSSSYLQSFPA